MPGRKGQERESPRAPKMQNGAYWDRHSHPPPQEAPLSATAGSQALHYQDLNACWKWNSNISPHLPRNPTLLPKVGPAEIQSDGHIYLLRTEKTLNIDLPGRMMGLHPDEAIIR